LPELERQNVLDELAAILEFPGSRDCYAHRPMDTEEAKSLARHGWIDTGAHTVTHLMMSRQSPTSQYDEIVISRAECEELVGQAPTGFAYRYGDMDSETASLVERAGFEYACSTAPGAVTPEANPFALPRVAVHDGSSRQLMRALS
jgi:peptidoglycan/xylan/chitin deacetylase (PgdA/CDA1 family)